MVDYSFEVALLDFLLVLLQLLQQELHRHLRLVLGLLVLEVALLASGPADHRLPDRAVVAEGSQAAREEVNWVPSNVDSSSLGNAVEVPGPLLVADSGGTEGDHLKVFEFSRGLDIDEAEAGKSSSETDTSNDQPGSVNVGSEVLEHVLPDGLPHIVVDLLDFASGGGVIVLPLGYN